MRVQIDLLVKLQHIEIEMRRLRSDLETKSTKFDNLDAEIVAYEHTLSQEETLLEALKKKYREYERDAHVVSEQIQKSQVKLSAVKTNKEYQSILKEIEDLETKSSQEEDAMLECLEQIDVADAKVKSKRTDFEQIKADVQQEKVEVQRDITQDQQGLKTLQVDWESVAESIDPEIINTYNTIKDTIGGIPVAAVSNAVCQGCHMNIPAQMYNELQRADSIKKCPHCQRIIYWKQDENRPK
ncbi:MAG: C4-type zinc ribbon domain-containing protein [Desulfobacterales bacterium]|nr:C4-type zinc ribbon domain-containing protein [Desulfobacterales bacterium]